MISYDAGSSLFINYAHILNSYIVWPGFYNMCCDASIRICIAVVKTPTTLALYLFDYIKIRWRTYSYAPYSFYYSNAFSFDINRNIRTSKEKQ